MAVAMPVVRFGRFLAARVLSGLHRRDGSTVLTDLAPLHLLIQVALGLKCGRRRIAGRVP